MGFLIFLLICVLIVLLVAPFIALAKASRAEQLANDLAGMVGVLHGHGLVVILQVDVVHAAYSWAFLMADGGLSESERASVEVRAA